MRLGPREKARDQDGGPALVAGPRHSDTGRTNDKPPDHYKLFMRVYIDSRRDVILSFHRSELIRVKPSGELHLWNGGYWRQTTETAMNDGLRHMDMQVRLLRLLPPACGRLAPLPVALTCLLLHLQAFHEGLCGDKRWSVIDDHGTVWNFPLEGTLIVTPNKPSDSTRNKRLLQGFKMDVPDWMHLPVALQKSAATKQAMASAAAAATAAITGSRPLHAVAAAGGFRPRMGPAAAAGGRSSSNGGGPAAAAGGGGGGRAYSDDGWGKSDTGGQSDDGWGSSNGGGQTNGGWGSSAAPRSSSSTGERQAPVTPTTPAAQSAAGAAAGSAADSGQPSSPPFLPPPVPDLPPPVWGPNPAGGQVVRDAASGAAAAPGEACWLWVVGGMCSTAPVMGWVLDLPARPRLEQAA